MKTNLESKLEVAIVQFSQTRLAELEAARALASAEYRKDLVSLLNSECASECESLLAAFLSEGLQVERDGDKYPGAIFSPEAVRLLVKANKLGVLPRIHHRGTVSQTIPVVGKISFHDHGSIFDEPRSRQDAYDAWDKWNTYRKVMAERS